ncbi:MAG: Vacuolar fusion protein mon1 [Chrysothrix sp. TS-e1954]|nr:MAG: Vacuolar fusion protein mon1 [Chrysothrix sp. TS-e1954]
MEPRTGNTVDEENTNHNEDDKQKGQPQGESDNLRDATSASSAVALPTCEGTPPPLPPRPQNQPIGPSKAIKNSPASLRIPKGAERPRYHSRATTAVSLAGTEAQVHKESSKGKDPGTSSKDASRRSSLLRVGLFGGGRSADHSDNASVRSLASRAPSVGTGTGDLQSLLGHGLGEGDESAWPSSAFDDASDESSTERLQFETQLASEFVDLDDLKADGSNEESLALAWSLKLKHFIILSSAGKPIWSRHGDDQLISGTIGVIQTIISAYQASDDVLKSFSAGNARFVILSKGHLHLLAVSRLGENDTQLRSQLEALYTQILSTLTLPNMERIFQNRPSTDLRRPLQGTEKLLSALADGFTRGSPSTLLSALECLRIRKAHRAAINNTFIKVRSPSLLYGLIVAGGRLVSVLRPKKHSLHPGDLQLIFNMLFETGAVRAGGDESWIPLCLPGFNSSGYVFMYVNYLPSNTDSEESTADSTNTGDTTSSATPPEKDEIAIVLISASRDSLDSLKDMRTSLISQLTANNSLALIRTAIHTPRPSTSSILAGNPLRHFLYKSRANVQFAMPSATPEYDSVLQWRRLMSVYGELHAAVHEKATQVKVYHTSTREHVALAWVSPVFEFYGIAGPGAGRNAVAMGASRTVQWARREEERLFIIGGAVF